MQPMVNLALRAARNAGQDLVRRLDRFDAAQSTDQEKAKFIADCTIGLEKGIIFELKKSLPDHNYEGRETGLNGTDDKQPTWQICVIDDIANFRVGIPAFAIIISCMVNGKTEHAVILNPMNGDEFTASRGRGAQLNNRRIRCGSQNTLSDAITAFTQPMGLSDTASQQRAKINTLMQSGYDVRSIGSNALTLSYVAADRFQAAFISDMDSFSLNAGGLIASEAGCLLADINGQPRIAAPANVAVANPRLLKSLLTL
ncbi:inositol monophosphatase family protein [Thalassolituus sp.]|uniref:inositol monophosphatase family protein n=1 Tax=Thalassolituus sp. TaxID=2030822 RepID=UPI002622F256|nr:inositol monophosphatase family protein [uncultured Thalassolituus sp.]